MSHTLPELIYSRMRIILVLDHAAVEDASRVPNLYLGWLSVRSPFLSSRQPYIVRPSGDAHLDALIRSVLLKPKSPADCAKTDLFPLDQAGKLAASPLALGSGQTTALVMWR